MVFLINTFSFSLECGLHINIIWSQCLLFFKKMYSLIGRKIEYSLAAPLQTQEDEPVLIRISSLLWNIVHLLLAILTSWIRPFLFLFLTVNSYLTGWYSNSMEILRKPLKGLVIQLIPKNSQVEQKSTGYFMRGSHMS